MVKPLAWVGLSGTSGEWVAPEQPDKLPCPACCLAQRRPADRNSSNPLPGGEVTLGYAGGGGALTGRLEISRASLEGIYGEETRGPLDCCQVQQMDPNGVGLKQSTWSARAYQ